MPKKEELEEVTREVIKEVEAASEGIEIPETEIPGIEGTSEDQMNRLAESENITDIENSLGIETDEYVETEDEPIEEGQLELKFDTVAENHPSVPVPEMIFQLNGFPLRLPRKENGGAYYLMDMLQYSDIDLNHPKGKINLLVNGEPGMFQQKLSEGDVIIIEEEIV